MYIYVFCKIQNIIVSGRASTTDRGYGESRAGKKRGPIQNYRIEALFYKITKN
jgi:hypothetical protein